MNDNPQRRRRHGSAPISDTRPLPVGSFNPEEWAEDSLNQLDYVRDTKPEKAVAHEGRSRVRRYLASLQHMLGDHPAFKHHAVRGDLAVLILALDGLDNCVEHEMLRKRKGGNRPRETKLDRQFRLLVLQMADHLILAGMERTPAYKFLATELTVAGQGALKPSLEDPGAPFEPDTIKRWYQQTRFRHEKGKEAEKPEDAEWLFWRGLERGCQTIPEAQQSVRTSLAEIAVRAVFPRCLKTPF